MVCGDESLGSEPQSGFRFGGRGGHFPPLGELLPP